MHSPATGFEDSLTPVNVTLLIDAIVRQTTVLIAQLATSAGARTPLAHTANQVFLDLVAELKHQGLGNKVIADMFGMALRTYHAKVQRLSESQTFRGQSLLTALLEYAVDKQTVSRVEVLRRFRQDDERVVRGALHDLTDSGLLFRSGRGDQTVYRVRTETDSAAGTDEHSERTAMLLWVTIHRFGPLTLSEVADHLHVEPQQLRGAIERLIETERVQEVADAEGVRYQCEKCVIPVGDELGWEAAVFDHYQAVVTTLCAKLRSGRDRARAGDLVGGSTYTYDVWEGHPHRQEVAGQLQLVREQAVHLRHKIEAYNQEHAPPAETSRERFITYVGQTVVRGEEQGEAEEND
jgi:hypothetical protein